MVIDWFATIKLFYENKHPLYTKEGIKVFVAANMLTPEKYQQITGEEYKE
ncbi:putative XkdX family phage protein [Paenibacillus favisporus]|uniref:XkdX family phage protein n=1 Tax=Paenibacillus favisporus TaxID=221028 RepID=A0ABV2FBM9_9BACL